MPSVPKNTSWRLACVLRMRKFSAGVIIRAIAAVNWSKIQKSLRMIEISSNLLFKLRERVRSKIYLSEWVSCELYYELFYMHSKLLEISIPLGACMKDWRFNLLTYTWLGWPKALITQNCWELLSPMVSRVKIRTKCRCLQRTGWERKKLISTLLVASVKENLMAM